MVKYQTCLGILIFLTTAFIVFLYFLAQQNVHTRLYPSPKWWPSGTGSLQNHPSSLSLPSPIRIIHQSWKTHSLPPRFKMWSDTWKTCFPNWTFKLWSNEDNEKFIQLHYPWFLPTYQQLPHDINRADAMRYFYMFHFGGIYADLDAECLRPFEHLLTNHSLVFGAMEGQYESYIEEGYVQNSFFYSTPHHPFWLEVVYALMHTSTGSAEARTGPILLIKVINQFRTRKAHEVKIYPPKYFNPFSWRQNSSPLPSSCKTLNEMTLEEYRVCRSHFNESYVVQYHSQSWGSGKAI